MNVPAMKTDSERLQAIADLANDIASAIEFGDNISLTISSEWIREVEQKLGDEAMNIDWGLNG